LKWRDLIYSRRVLKVLPEADILVTNTFWLPILAPKAGPGKIYVHVARHPKGQMKLYGRAVRLQTVSCPIREAICKEAPGLAARVRVIPNFVPTFERQYPEAREKTILYVGRVHPEKGVHLLLDAFERLLAAGTRQWKLRVVGPWDAKHGGGGVGYIRDLRAKSRKFEECVEWTGPVFETDELNAHYSQCSVFVYPSLAERGESFGLAPLEAMAAGCPPVVSSLACFEDFVKTGFNGWIFDHRSENRAANLANILTRLVGETDTLRKAGECAYRTARDYTLPKVACQYLSDFEEVACL
jgi:glycosyltransferase involved in cell wall biosynthesis